MIKNKRIYTVKHIIVILLIFTACNNPIKTQSFEETREKVSDENSANLTSSAAQINEGDNEIFTPQAIIDSSTPTPDIRIPAEQWQEWPIIPEVTNNAVTIYRKGKEQIVDSRAFSKIGDCQNIKEAFLGIYDRDGRYFLIEDEKSWQETIDNFKGYFNKDGMAIEQGLNVAAALSPLHADPDVCELSENPLQCEFRVANPSFAFISFERWWPKITPPEVYEKYLRIVIQETIDQGTVPILITKADNVEGNHQINQIIAKLAFEFDIPLYNWWKAAQSLPHRGLDPERDDNFHISTEAWDSRSYYALQTLDKLWKGLNDS